MSDFDAAFTVVIGHEGGYANDPHDPGGETKFGISKRSYPDLNIAGLTVEDAKAIYRRDYWSAVRGDELPDPLGVNVFDAAVNSGRGNAIRWMQTAAGVAADGKFGPITMAAVTAAAPNALTARFLGVRLRFMTDLSTWERFNKGWARRVAANLMGFQL